MIKLLLSLFLGLTVTQTFSQSSILLVGTYDSPKSEGIYVYDFNALDGSAREKGHIETSNPSFISVSPDKKFVFAVNENSNTSGKAGSVTSFSFNKKLAVLSKINIQPSEGNDPCYLSTDKTGHWLIVGNYSSGNAALLAINKNGLLSKAKQLIQLEGKGLDNTRQQSPHVHTTVFSENNHQLFVTDLGTDKIMCYNFDALNGKISTAVIPFIKVEAGAGPRHLVLAANEKFIYLLTELKGAIFIYEKVNSNWKNVQQIPATSLNFKGVAGSADIHISADGNFLYASNRGESNSIGIFKINKITGKLTFLAQQSTLGLTPRNFSFDPSGKYLLVANQNSNEIVIFKRNSSTGLLTYTGNRIMVGKPVCLKWL